MVKKIKLSFFHPSYNPTGMSQAIFPHHISLLSKKYPAMTHLVFSHMLASQGTLVVKNLPAMQEM